MLFDLYVNAKPAGSVDGRAAVKDYLLKQGLAHAFAVQRSNGASFNVILRNGRCRFLEV